MSTLARGRRSPRTVLAPALLSLVSGVTAVAHPGHGLVVDSTGQIHFVDLANEEPRDGEAHAPDLDFIQATAWGRDGSILLTENGTVWRLERDGRLVPVGRPSSPGAERAGDHSRLAPLLV